MADAAQLLTQQDPDVNTQLLQSQQRMALAQALSKDALTPIDTQGVRVSPLSVLAKALAGYGGASMGNQAAQQMGQAQSKMAQNYMNGMQGFFNQAPQAAQSQDQASQMGSGGQTGAQPSPIAGGVQPVASVAGPTVAGLPDLLRNDPKFQKMVYGEKMGFLPQGTAANYAQAAYKNAALTDQQKNDAGAGITPAMRQQMMIAEAKKNSEIERKAGNEFQNFYTGQSGIVPKIPENTNPVGAISPNGAIAGGVAPMPGALAASQNNAQADQQGKTNANVINVTTADGKIVPVYGGAAAGRTTTELGLGGSGGARSASSASPVVSPAGGPAMSAKPTGATTLGQSQDNKISTDQGGALYADIQNKAGQVPLKRQALDEVTKLISTPGVTFGPGTPELATLKAKIGNVIGVDLSKSQTEQDVMGKLSAYLSTNELGQGGTGTNAQLETIMHKYPNGGMTVPAMQKVIPLLNQQNDVDEARGKFAQKYANNKAALNQDLPAFNALADPETVSLGRQMLKASQNGTLKQFDAQQQKIDPEYLVKKNRIITLNHMGAF